MLSLDDMLLRSLIIIVVLLMMAGNRLISAHLFPQPGPLEAITRPYQYDIWRWEGENLYRQFLGATASSPEASEVVAEYFALNQRIGQIQSQAAGSPSLGQEVALLEERRNALRAAVEKALQEEMTAVFREQGLTLFGGGPGGEGLVFPPVKFALTRLPHILIVSPRERIDVEDRALLLPEMGLDQIEAVEAAVEAQGKSALIESIGGFATYPSMIPEDGSLEFVVDTAAHEWVHNYLFLRPLGMRYADSYDMTTINETVADLVGRELGDLILKRLGRPRPAPPPPRPPDPTAFDFNREMRAIRLEVDSLLSQGLVAEAEAAMKKGRDSLAGHGYYIRKLNQAYFAFHGSYADSPTSVSPVAGQLRRLRQSSPSVATFLARVASFARPEDLEEALSVSLGLGG